MFRFLEMEKSIKEEPVESNEVRSQRLRCPVCLVECVALQELPCGQSLCLVCLNGFVDEGPGDGEGAKIECPTCDTVHRVGAGKEREKGEEVKQEPTEHMRRHTVEKPFYLVQLSVAVSDMHSEL